MKLCASPMGNAAARRSVLVLTVKSRPRKTRCKRSDSLLAKPSYLVQPSRAVRRSRRTQRKWRLEVIDRACIALLQKGRQHSRPNNFAVRVCDSQDQKLSRLYKKAPALKDAARDKQSTSARPNPCFSQRSAFFRSDTQDSYKRPRQAKGPTLTAQSF